MCAIVHVYMRLLQMEVTEKSRRHHTRNGCLTSNRHCVEISSYLKTKLVCTV